MTNYLTILLRMLGVAALAMLLLASPAVARGDDDHDDDDHQHSTQTVTDTHDDGHRTGTATAESGSDDDRFGTFIRTGTCQAPGDVVEGIDELDDDDRDDDDDDWEKLGGDEPRPEVLYSDDEDVDRTVDALVGGEFVVTVHEAGSADSAVIACGAIAGEVDANGALLIDLEEVDDSGFEGRAHFAPDHDDDHDDETEVTVGIWAVQPAGV